MEKQVLTIEQMQELQELGLDTIKASMYWVKSITSGSIWELSPVKPDFGFEWIWISTFTLQDILDILPQGFYLEKNTTSLDKKVFLQINKTAGGGYSIAYEQSWDEDGKLKIKMHGQQLNDSLLEAAFNILKWCKLNNKL